MSSGLGLSSSSIVKIIGIAVVIAALLTAFYFYVQYNSLRKQMSQKKDEVSVLIGTIGKMIELPTNELPTIATVSNTSKLSDDAFFKNAKNGDKVLIFENAKKAILFRPSLNKIIEVGPFHEKEPTPTPIPSSQQKEVTVTILNGTKKTGLTKSAQEHLKQWDYISVVRRSDAKGDEYPKSVIYDVGGNNTGIVKEIASYIKADIIKSMPDGEDKTTSDILLILGDNYENRQ